MWWSAPARNPIVSWQMPCSTQGIKVHVIGGADVAAELDAKRAIAQGARLASRL